MSTDTTTTAAPKKTTTKKAAVKSLAKSDAHKADCAGPLYLGSGTTITHSRIAGGVEAGAGSEGVEVHCCVIGPPQATGLGGQ